MLNESFIEYRLICVSNSRGLQHYTARLANALSETGGIKLTVAAQDDLLNLLNTDVNKLRLPSRRYSLKTLLAIGKSIFCRRTTILHYQGINLVTLLLLYLASKSGRFVILTPHNVETHFRNRLYNLIKWWLWRGFDMIVLHTEAELKLVPHKLHSRINIIPHGEYSPSDTNADISDEVVQRLRGCNDYIIAPGFIRDDKNIDFLVNNHEVLKDHELDLVVAGRNQSSFSNEKIVKVAKHFDGFLQDNDLIYLIKNAKAVILPYDKVSESGILHQALSVGTPVIVSDIPGFQERVREGENGLFLRANTPEALSDALNRLTNYKFNPEEIRRKHLTEFSWSTIALRLRNAINEYSLRH